MKSFKKTTKNEDQESIDNAQNTNDSVGNEPKLNGKKKLALKWVALVLILLALLSSASYAGYRYAKSEDKETKMEDSSKVESIKKDSTDDTKTTKSADSVGPEAGGYKVSKPTGWLTRSCDDNPDIFFLAPSEDLLGKCQTEYFGTVSISKIDGDIRRNEEYYTSDDYYRSPAFSSVTIDGLPGYRVSYSVAQESELGYPPIGTFEYFYTIYDSTEGVSYKIGYRELPTGTDYQSKFIEIAESFRRI